MRLQLLTLGSTIVLVAALLFTLTAIDLSEARSQELQESPFLREISLDSKDIFKKPKPIEEPLDSDIIIDEIIYPVPYAYTDYNNDGLVDLIREERDGKTYVYINTASDDSPIYKGGISFKGDKSILQYPEISKEKKSRGKTTSSIQTWVELNYDRYDVFIETDFYNANQATLTDFFNKFEPRFDLLESTTQWSSEDVVGTRLMIEVEGVGGCYGGFATSGTVFFKMSNPFPMSGCQNPYYANGTPYFGNPGELGDNWGYIGSLIHESTHGINPEPILFRRWLTEGLGEFYQYNILSNYGDINQETSDYYIYAGTSGRNWADYVANDYRDTTSNNFEIQKSLGYDITAWMFSMLRDDYSLDWNSFYTLMKDNSETLDYTRDTWGDLNNYYTDMVVLDMFGRALGWSFDETTAVFRYDGPSGPGWGVRQWMPIDWYADLVPELTVSNAQPAPGSTITLNTKIFNNGDVSLQDVSVKIYRYDLCAGSTELLYEEVINLAANSDANIQNDWVVLEGRYQIIVKVDSDNLKLETNESNNMDYKTVSSSEDTCEWIKLNGRWVQRCRTVESRCD